MPEGIRIVVVDDDDLFRPMLVGNLAEAGFVVREYPVQSKLPGILAS